MKMRLDRIELIEEYFLISFVELDRGNLSLGTEDKKIRRKKVPS
jgi:hypothetical protein